jgi:hypothetical protein
MFPGEVRWSHPRLGVLLLCLHRDRQQAGALVAGGWSLS